MSDINAWGTARKMIEIYGGEAQLEVKRRREKALERNDQQGFQQWDLVAAVIGGRDDYSAVQPVQQSN
jgi:hypothetical protein